MRRHIATANQPATSPSATEPKATTTKCSAVFAIANCARRDGRQRRRVDHERGGVVEQAFAVDDRDDVTRQPKALEHGDRRQLVGRRDDGAENERRGPRHARDDRVREDGDRGCRHEDEPERERRDLTAVLPHDVGRRGDRFPIQQRREKDQQHEVGVELDLRQPRHEPEDEPAGNQRDGIGNVEALRQRNERDGDRQQRDEKPGLEINHRAPAWSCPPAGNLLL